MSDKLTKWMVEHLSEEQQDEIIKIRERMHVISVLPPEAMHYKKKSRFAQETYDPQPITKEGLLNELGGELDALKKRKEAEETHNRQATHGLLNQLGHMLDAFKDSKAAGEPDTKREAEEFVKEAIESARHPEKADLETSHVETLDRTEPTKGIFSKIRQSLGLGRKETTREATTESFTYKVELEAQDIVQTKNHAKGEIDLKGGTRILVHSRLNIPENEVRTVKDEYFPAVKAIGSSKKLDLQVGKFVKLHTAKNIAKTSTNRYERELVLEFSQVAEGDSYFQAIDEMLGEKCQQIEIVVLSKLSQHSRQLTTSEFRLTVVRPDTIETGPLPTPVSLKVQVIEPESQQMESELDEDIVLRFKEEIEPADTKLKLPMLKVFVLGDNKEHDFKGMPFFEIMPIHKDDEYVVTIKGSKARKRTWKSLFDYAERTQNIKHANGLRLELHLETLKGSIKSKATVNIVRPPPGTVTAAQGTSDEPKIDVTEESPVAAALEEAMDEPVEATGLDPTQRKMMQLLHKTWKVYKAYCHETRKKHMGERLFEVDGAIVENLDRNLDTQQFFATKEWSRSFPMIIVHYPEERWAIALPDPSNYYDHRVQWFYKGLNRKNWAMLTLHSDSLGANTQQNIALHFKHICIVEQVEDNWKVLAQGEVEENTVFNSNHIT